jgi:hypothetical protein
MHLAQPSLAAFELPVGVELAYLGLLVLSGLMLLIVAALPIGTPPWSRILNVVVGAGMLGYAYYIMFLLEPGETYRVIFYVFVLPIVLVAQTFKAAKANREAKRAAAAQRAAADRAAADRAAA